jgi:hypothetical protein
MKRGTLILVILIVLVGILA